VDSEASQTSKSDENPRTAVLKIRALAIQPQLAKHRVTALLYNNASIDRMLKPIIINKALHPCASKGHKFSRIDFKANKIARVNH